MAVGFILIRFILKFNFYLILIFKSVWRSIQSRGMAERYGQEQEYAAALKKFSVLAFCDVQVFSLIFYKDQYIIGCPTAV